MTIMKRLALIAAVAALLAPSAFADDCDPLFNGAEAYLCKTGRVEHKFGLKVDERFECVELKKLTLTGCTVEQIKTDPAQQIVYLLGNKAMKEAINNFEWQCDVKGGNAGGGMKTTLFEGYLHPNYTIDKFPGEMNTDRNNRFTKDLEKEGKYVLTAVSFENPVSEYNKKFDNQVCQYYNMKTNKVAFIFNCNINFAGLNDKKEEPKESPIGKGFKSLFGR